MVFSSSIFLFVFLPVLIVLYYNPLAKSRRCKNTILLLASIAFYAWGEPVFVFIMLAMTAVNWRIGLRIAKSGLKKARIWKNAAITACVLLLVIFKYLTFITENIAALSGNDSIIVKISLPIGISFFTFQMMSYIFDIADGRSKPRENLFDVMLYITMFPQLIAGPIVRYETIEKEIPGRAESLDLFFEGALRFIKGLAKKVLIANNIAILADAVFGYEAGTRSACTAWLGAIAYTLQIYFDFSGYSDMAIGLGAMFGFHFPENFDRPYISKTITEFWRRWHITMGTWFRDYVYIPMGGSRVGSAGRHILNLFVVWLLTGLWHGADWNFVVWGLMYFCLLVLEKALRLDKRDLPVGNLYTMFFVVIGWVLFRADSLHQAGDYLLSMFGANGFSDANFAALMGQFWYLIILGVVLSVVKIKQPEKPAFKVLSGCFWCAAFALSVTFIVKGGYDPFIYFNF